MLWDKICALPDDIRFRFADPMLYEILFLTHSMLLKLKHWCVLNVLLGRGGTGLFWELLHKHLARGPASGAAAPVVADYNRKCLCIVLGCFWCLLLDCCAWPSAPVVARRSSCVGLTTSDVWLCTTCLHSYPGGVWVLFSFFPWWVRGRAAYRLCV